MKRAALPVLLAVLAAAWIHLARAQGGGDLDERLADLSRKLDTVIAGQAKLDTIIENQERILQMLRVIRRN
ncbi:MAG: hypothetical protein PHN82_11630 [bacterium]|nr:hypothetical protein [bacterium]